MEAVMLSIRPEWCEKIAHGKKTVEVRKTKPKLETPFKCYIYCTKDKYGHLYVNNTGNCREELPLLYTKHNATSLVPKGYINGMVVGEFVCDKITYLGNVSTDPWDMLLGEVHEYNKQLITKQALLSESEIHKYAAGKMLYGYHISELKIYDKPKELREFLIEDNRTFDCPQLVAMKRAPQSWCYVEGVCDNGSDN